MNCSCSGEVVRSLSEAFAILAATCPTGQCGRWFGITIPGYDPESGCDECGDLLCVAVAQHLGYVPKSKSPNWPTMKPYESEAKFDLTIRKALRSVLQLPIELEDVIIAKVKVCNYEQIFQHASRLHHYYEMKFDVCQDEIEELEVQTRRCLDKQDAALECQKTNWAIVDFMQRNLKKERIPFRTALALTEYEEQELDLDLAAVYNKALIE